MRTPHPLTPSELARHREALVMTQAELGEALGFAPAGAKSTIWRWEHGHRDIPVWATLAVECLLWRRGLMMSDRLRRR